jgi:hypothetical protein
MFGAVGPFQVAQAHAMRGEVDQAFEWLERSYAERDPGLTEMKCTPCLRPLHGDPRWGEFLRRLWLAP